MCCEIETKGKPNIRCAVKVPAMPPRIWAQMYPSASVQEIPLSIASANVTAGFRCEPEIGPKVRIKRDEYGAGGDGVRQKGECDVSAGKALGHDSGADYRGDEKKMCRGIRLRVGA